MAEGPRRPLEEQLRAWAEDVAAQVPPWSPDSTLQAPGRGRHRPGPGLVLGAVAVAAAVLLVAGVVYDSNRGRGVSITAGSGAEIEVEYERSEYTQTADLECTPRPQDSSPTFDRFVREAWADRKGKRWRTTITYPDGSTLDTIDLDSPYYPSEEFRRGRDATTVIGCGDVILLAGPSGGSLNTMAEIPMIQSPGRAEPFAAVRRIPPDAEVVSGEHRDSRRRSAELLRAVTRGFGDAGRPVEQVREWFLRPGTDVVLESTYSNKQEGLGSAQQRTTLTTFETRRVHSSLFDNEGYEPQGGRPLPPSATQSEKTVVAEGTLSDKAWSVAAYYRQGEVCLEFGLDGAGSTSCGDKLGPIVVKLAVVGSDRVLFGTTSPGIQTLRIELEGAAPLVAPTTDRGFSSFGYQFYAVVLPLGVAPTRVTTIDASGEEQFTTIPLQLCAGPDETAFSTCRADG